MSKTIKLGTYQKATGQIQTRLTAVLEKVQELARGIKDEPLTQVQVRRAAGYLAEARKRQDEYESNLRRTYESPDDEFQDVDLSTDQNKISELVGDITSRVEALCPETAPLSPADRTPVQPTVAPPLISQVSLPKLALRHFSGELSSWVSFFSLYNSAIHANTSLSATLKMQYLLGSLSGEPLAMVSALQITAANYIIAYDLLRTRYHNVRRLKTFHLTALIWDLPLINHSKPEQWRTFINLYNEHSQALASLDAPLSGDDPFLAMYLLVRFDKSMASRLEQYRSQHEAEPHTLPSVQEVLAFLNQACDIEEDASGTISRAPPPSRETGGRGFTPSSRRGYQQRPSPFSAASGSQQRGTTLLSREQESLQHRSPPWDRCFFCRSGEHKIYGCTKFNALTPQDRSKEIRRLNRCISCLGNHVLRDCQSMQSCKQCHKRHHTLLHFEFTPRSSQEVDKTSSGPDQASAHHVTLASNNALVAQTIVLLGTALIKLKNSNGYSQTFRGLLDSGSSTSFITEHAAQMLRSTRQHSNLQVAGISGNTSHTQGLTQIDICTQSGALIAPAYTLHILKKISVPLPRATVTHDVVQKATRYVLADPAFHRPGPIDVLLGADLFPLLLTNQTCSLGADMPTLVGTSLGYVVLGKTTCLASSDTVATNHHSVALLSTSDMHLHNALQQFWHLEEPPACTHKTLEEQQCDEHYANTHSRTCDGRYCVALPFKGTMPDLGLSRPSAEKRFLALERKFKVNPRFAHLYQRFMLDYEERGHMSKANDIELSLPHYFLPHHGILKGIGECQKIRTVFDASAKSSSGTSLNELLMVGPKLQVNISDLLLKFRTHKIVFTCDVEQMYRQILVSPEHHKYQLILWRPSPSQPMDVYKLLTVTYGTSCAPYLAIRTLHQLAEDEGAHFPAAAEVLKHQTYVDDILSGGDNLLQARQLQQELINLLKCGGFVLKKWSSNHPELLSHLPSEHLGTPAFLEPNSQAQLSVLGLRWSPQSDQFNYHLNLPHAAQTKRQVLSLVAQIYDPCGFLSPVTMRCKIFMQALWSLGLNWDDSLPPEYQERWQTLQAELPMLSDIKISRPFSTANAKTVELHGFCDASESGYAAVLYLRCIYQDGSAAVHLILAKTRVAPLKRVTLPRLELCGAHLLAQLTRYITATLSHIEFSAQHLWCDSSVVLAWLRTSPHRLKTFVANRVAQIQDWVPVHCFQHISGTYNPADCASRGIPPSQLRDHPLWWSGPPWLLDSGACPSLIQSPPALSSELPSSAQEELKNEPFAALLAAPRDSWDLLSRYSSWDRLQRVLALVLRFKDNIRRPQDRRSGSLSAAELLQARLTAVRLVQRCSFHEDLSALKRQMQPSQRLRHLSPFLDQEGLLRVGGRLAHSALPLRSKHPLLLPKDHPVVDLIIDAHHIRHLHAGPQLTQAVLSQAYWVLSARSKIRSRIFKCIACFKQRPRFQSPKMADLPAPRVTPSKPFSSTGIDYAGPFLIKMHNLRSMKQIKVYLCIFICLAIKAVHLEVVTDLTTDAFIAALSRFMSRRGRCSHIYSDCGTNFVGAASELKAIVQDLKSPESQQRISQFAAPLEINFHFNPPSAPHFGGLWESAVKSAKHHLRRVMGDHLLTLPEFITLVTRVEAMLNSRPLTPLSADPQEIAVLTPGHFLTGEPLTSVPEPLWHDTPVTRLRRFQLVQALSQHLWRRWHAEYLHTLQQRPKWTAPQRELQVGDLVLISAPSPPLTWPIGRVSALHPGADGILRVVEVTTLRGSYRRPVVKLARLPVDA